jgi:MFS transporter, SP family, inositol transporter
VLHVVGMAMLAVFGFKLEIVIAHIVIMGIAGGFGAQIIFQLWSAELFPTAIRLSAQGVTFAVVRVGLGIWSLAVPSLASNDFYHSGLDFDRFPGHKRARRGVVGTAERGQIARTARC